MSYGLDLYVVADIQPPKQVTESGARVTDKVIVYDHLDVSLGK
jgi:hypothetical protein